MNVPNTTRRLYRCREDRQIAGVAGGIAEYLEIDPTVVRILWILSFFLGGFGLLLYVIMAFVVPLEPVGYGMGTAPLGTGPRPTTDGSAEAGTDGEPIHDAPAAGAASQEAAPAGTGWQAPVHGQAFAHGGSNPAWHAERRSKDGRGGNGMMVFGVLLVTFGLLALLGPIFPGWIAGAALGPAFLVALGIALLAGALRRQATDR